jgi:hypothetical protein
MPTQASQALAAKGSVPAAFGATIRDHYRSILESGGDLHSVRAKIQSAAKPDMTADADTLAAEMVKQVMAGKASARAGLKQKNVTPMRRKLHA